ncbi:MAG: hypothetical protein ABR530_07630 [Pyrinomonadaceae bacterium]
MKICPRCQKTYADDNLNFCLEDGSVLTMGSPEMPPTVVMGEPRVTQPQPQLLGQPTAQPSWNTPQQYSMQPPRKSSKAWIWVLGILAALVLVCGGGLIGFLALVGSQVDTTSSVATDNNRSNSQTLANRSKTTSTSTSTSTSSSSRDDLETVDLSSWVREYSAYGNTEFVGNEFVMSAKQRGFYYVLVAPEGYSTDDADTRVTLRNVDNASGNLGYGLIFHSNPTPLQQDYAFLIDTKRKKYRVVHHGPQKESSVIAWTSSPAINEGSAENTLEARDLTDKIELYINGTMVDTIKNVYGYAGGVAGLYSGDGVKVAFKNLEIRK